MEIKTLKSHTRQIKSGPTAKALRRSGLMPAVVYGQGKTPLTLTIDMHEFTNLLGYVTNQSLISLDIEGDTALSKTVMIKELQRHPISRKLVHADFYEVDLTKKIHVHVTVTTTGKSIGVEKGGTLEIIRRSLGVVCLPASIPESITIDIADLDIGDAVHVSQIVTGADVELAWDPDEESDYTVITIAAPTVEKASEEGEEESAEATAEAEKDEKKEEAE